MAGGSSFFNRTSPLFLLDTGDIVDDGSKADQFEELRGYLSRLAEMPFFNRTSPLFLLDTGDIVDDGSKADQFEELRGYLSRLAEMPYLVGVGNHELQPKGGSPLPLVPNSDGDPAGRQCGVRYPPW